MCVKETQNATLSDEAAAKKENIVRDLHWICYPKSLSVSISNEKKTKPTSRYLVHAV